MVFTRMSLAEIKARAHDVDRAKVEGASEADIQRFQVEDDEDPDSPSHAGRLVVPAASVRAQLGVTQRAFSDLTGIPIGTLRNWEQDRVPPEPAARALFTILAREPGAALRALGGKQPSPPRDLEEVSSGPDFQQALRRGMERSDALARVAMAGAIQIGRVMEQLWPSTSQNTGGKTA